MRAPAGEETERIDLISVLAALRRQVWVILALLVVGLSAAVAAFHGISPRYTSTAWVLIDPTPAPVAEPDSRAAPTRPETAVTLENEIRYLTSRIVLDQVVRELDLGRQPEFVAALRKVRTDDPVRLDQALHEIVRDRVAIRRTGQSEVLGVSVTLRDAKLAADMANAIVGVYLDARRAEKVEAVGRTARWLEERTIRLRQELIEAESAIEEYRSANALATGNSAVLGGQDLPRLRAELATARATAAEKAERRRVIMEMLARGQDFKPVTELASSPIVANLIQQSEDLQRRETYLLATFGPKHPEVLEVRSQRQRLDRQMVVEVNNIVENLRVEAEASEARHRLLSSIISDAEQQTVAAGLAEVRLRELEREAAGRRSVYEATLLRLTDLQGQSDAIQPDAKLLTAAGVPLDPSFPKLGVLLGIGAVGSLLAGLGVAALREHLDRGVRTGRQIETALGVPAVGILPRLEGPAERGRAHRTMVEQPTSPFAEAARSIATRLNRLRRGPGSQVLLVTSAVAGEGKTTLATSLATVTALGGRRTILVELDLRRPTLAREFGLTVTVGLAEVVAGSATTQAAIQEVPGVPNLEVLPVRQPTQEAPHILSSATLVALIRLLRREYDEVILDAPPTLGLSDVGSILPLADTVLYAIRWGETTQELAAEGMAQLAANGMAVVGTALTQVDLRRQRQYTYGYPVVAAAYGPATPLRVEGPR